MGSVQRRKSLAHLSNLKQESNELLKKYMTRFEKEVAQIEDASDVAVIAAFTNGLQSGRLSFDLRRDRQKTYEEMMDIACDYALAEEEEVAQGVVMFTALNLTQSLSPKMTRQGSNLEIPEKMKQPDQ